MPLLRLHFAFKALQVCWQLIATFKVITFKKSFNHYIFCAITILLGISIALTQLDILPAAASHVEQIASFILVSIAMKGPMGQIFGSMNQLLLGAPRKEETIAINDIVVSRMEGISPGNYKVRPTKQGDMLYVSILLSENFADSYPDKVNSLQAIKSMISTDLRDQFPINRIEFSL